MRLFALAALVSGSLSGAACTTIAETERALPGQTAEQAANAFVEAFNSLDPPRFEAFFADDVTMFFPSGPFPKRRVDGKQAVTAAFARFFGMLKERGATRLNIKPIDVRVQDYGTFAVATFHLTGNGNVGRRSILLRPDRGRWRIVHFHASSL